MWSGYPLDTLHLNPIVAVFKDVNMHLNMLLDFMLLYWILGQIRVQS
jgi:hypothetical protein